MSAIRIIVDERIPLIADVLKGVADVVELPANDFTPQTVADADALIIRTRTRCDARLLADSKVSFIGSATIGTDHIDLPWCRNRGIKVANAPGCNAPAVAQWTLATIGNHISRCGASPSSLTIGIIGVGHVGSIVARWAEGNGFNVLLNDPPRAESEEDDGFVDLNTLLTHSDIITVHTPLTDTGRHATRHLLGAEQLERANRCSLLLNAARGGIVDETALATHFHGDIAIDCWETEPEPERELLRRAFVATPHIAGYSLEGKHRASAMILNELAQQFDFSIPPMNLYPAANDRPTLSEIMASYNPLADTQTLRANPDRFEQIRNTYTLRHEVGFFDA